MTSLRRMAFACLVALGLGIALPPLVPLAGLGVIALSEMTAPDCRADRLPTARCRLPVSAGDVE